MNLSTLYYQQAKLKLYKNKAYSAVLAAISLQAEAPWCSGQALWALDPSTAVRICPELFFKLIYLSLLRVIVEEDKPDEQYCELTDSMLPANHPYFSFLSEIRLAQAFLGMAISTGKRLEELRKILDMLDTLAAGVEDPDSKLADRDRKMLNHDDEVWLDLKEKMSAGDSRAANLLAASAHIRNAASQLLACRQRRDLGDSISDYTLNYLKKLSVHAYREAMGHVMM